MSSSSSWKEKIHYAELKQLSKHQAMLNNLNLSPDFIFSNLMNNILLPAHAYPYPWFDSFQKVGVNPWASYGKVKNIHLTFFRNQYNTSPAGFIVPLPRGNQTPAGRQSLQASGGFLQRVVMEEVNQSRHWGLSGGWDVWLTLSLTHTRAKPTVQYSEIPG